MSDLLFTYNLTRGRFADSLTGFSHAQLNWRIHPDSLTIGEMALHVAGVERWFVAQLRGETLEGENARLAKAATDGSINTNPFPFAEDEITPEFVAATLAATKALASEILTENSDAIRAVKIKSALGPEIDGTGAFARLAFHPGYHHGQVYLISTAPGFPQA